MGKTSNGYGRVFQPLPENGGGLYITTKSLGDEVEIKDINPFSPEFGKKEILDIRDSSEDKMKYNRAHVFSADFTKDEIGMFFGTRAAAGSILKDVLSEYRMRELSKS